MGYTQYWYQKPELDPETFKLFVQDVKKLHHLTRVRIDDDAKFEDELVYFEGYPETCEPFYVERVFGKEVQRLRQFDTEGRLFRFCKTRLLDYDLLVAAALVMLKYRFKDDVAIACDEGDESGFSDGYNYCRDLVGEDLPPLTELYGNPADMDYSRLD